MKDDKDVVIVATENSKQEEVFEFVSEYMKDDKDVKLSYKKKRNIHKLKEDNTASDKFRGQYASDSELSHIVHLQFK